MRCRFCGVPQEYYSSYEHSGRKSCHVSSTGYHQFVWDSTYNFIKVYSFVCSLAKNA